MRCGSSYCIKFASIRTINTCTVLLLYVCTYTILRVRVEVDFWSLLSLGSLLSFSIALFFIEQYTDVPGKIYRYNTPPIDLGRIYVCIASIASPRCVLKVFGGQSPAVSFAARSRTARNSYLVYRVVFISQLQLTISATTQPVTVPRLVLYYWWQGNEWVVRRTTAVPGSMYVYEYRCCCELCTVCTLLSLEPSVFEDSRLLDSEAPATIPI